MNRGTEQAKPSEATESGFGTIGSKKDQTLDSEGAARRAALAALAKHAAYTTPAVLAMVSLTAKRAAAGSF